MRAVTGDIDGRAGDLPGIGTGAVGRIAAGDVVAPDAPGSQRPMRVLAAEDNPVFQAMLKTMLTRWGYQAVMARNGTEACRIL